ncbi:MAG: threonine synthase [Cyanobacteria bacterium NC_groundwater_1444_Ag_S-0.65um_54_12]|nr:threonine synthase [Cyanobacteria bacterium NC_groundwater_1444_Ag_S-0.65um_54_12]
MTNVIGLECVVCGRHYPPSDIWTCPNCGQAGILDVRYAATARFTAADLAERPHDLWRYQELLPITATSQLPPLQVGWTPLYQAPRLARELRIKQIWVKDEGRNATASFKDRASVIGVARALASGAKTIACASTGNAASSLAGIAASVGLPAVIFVPEHAPDPKLAQILLFGATVIRVQGNYDQTWELCQEACAHFGWYNRNAAVNPYLIEGKKTAGHEIAEKLGPEIPDWIAVAVGDGCTIAGVWKGLCEMRQLGFIPRLPRLLGVQAEGANAIAAAFFSGKAPTPAPAATMADSIAVGAPRNWRKALRAVSASVGTFICVSDEEILLAMRVLGRQAAIFAEPAGAAALAGLAKASKLGLIGTHEQAIVLVTGNGLKDVKSAMRAADKPFTLPPDLRQLITFFEKSR